MQVNLAPVREIRDPIHGGIAVDAVEKRVIDHPFVQRLRGIRQLGFSHLPFPGATHTRFSHSLGVMHLAGLAFDACFRDDPFIAPGRRQALRHCVRLAALCHDLGHGPFSHAAEFAMPALGTLPVQAFAPAGIAGRLDRRAMHEDYTIAIITASDLARVITESFPFAPAHVAGLVSPEVAVEDDFFMEDGVDLRGLLSQLVSSNLDADRLDYLVRDSYYTGARYGQVDVGWLISHLGRHIDSDGRLCLALDRRALYAFDDFMVARFHMFVMVYFHQKSVAYEEMLKRSLGLEGCDYRLPADLDEYRRVDDVHLLSWLRTSGDPWARRIVEHRPLRVVAERHEAAGGSGLTAERERLQRAGIEFIETSATGAILAPRKAAHLPIYVVDHGGRQRAESIETAASIFRRYADERVIHRLYVSDLQQAQAILDR